MLGIDQNNPELCGLSWATKVICSGVFITGRDPKEILTSSCIWMAASDHMVKQAIDKGDPSALLELPVEIDVDHDTKTVQLSLNGKKAWARYFGDQGTVILPSPDAEIAFTPKPVPVSAKDDNLWGAPGETGDAGRTGCDPEKLNAAADLLFENDLQFTNAFLVIHKGELLIERYRAPFNAKTQFESWSMGKSIASTLVGVACQRGDLSLDEADLFAEWRGADDPRRDIKVRNIVNMASGLEFLGSYGVEEDHSVKSIDGRFLDHIYVYGGGVDSYTFCIDKPLQDPPGTAGRYRNCDPLLATALVRQRSAGGDIQDFLTWPQKHLFDKLGMTGMVLETDPYGHFLISGHDYGRARDWGRLGLLYAQRGAWGREQIIPEAHVDFVSTPAKEAWAHNPYYGGFFYTNATNLTPALPKDAYFMSGGGKQRVTIVPSLDLVMVRLGHMAGQIFGLLETMDDANKMIVEAMPRA
ncbi:MAG: serine hydrolase [Pseudomonadota bacterium]